MGSFIMLALNINALIGVLESENIILAYVHESLSESDARALEPRIRAIHNISSATFISREEAMQSFARRFSDSNMFEDIDVTIFRHRYAIYVEDVSQIVQTQETLRNIRELGNINANHAIAQTLVSVRNVVTWISVIIIAVLLVISLFIMQNTIKLATYERREEIALMKMVGATNAFIRWPFIIEGFILGMTGSILAYAAVRGLYELAASNMFLFEGGFFSLITFSTSISIPIFLLFIGIGFAVGVGGSVIALNRYLKV
jgi:cell division transport system permease protein